MKKYTILLWLFVLGLMYVGCKENEIDIYQETPRLNMYLLNDYVTFADSDYVKGYTQKEWDVRVKLQGYNLTEDRNFCLKVRPNDEYTLQAGVSFADKYVFHKDSIYEDIKIIVKRPEKLTEKVPCRADICFDTENNLHGFDVGREDLERTVLEVSYVIRPNNWSVNWWGKYSDAKYFFMMDHFKATLNDIPATPETQQEIYDAYEEYKKNNPPLKDEKGDEILFKKPE